MILERSYFLSFTFDFDLVKNRSYDALLLLIVSLKPRHERNQSFLVPVPARSQKGFSAGPSQKNIFVLVRFRRAGDRDHFAYLYLNFSLNLIFIFLSICLDSLRNILPTKVYFTVNHTTIITIFRSISSENFSKDKILPEMEIVLIYNIQLKY
jgi:hypothetical protein